MSDFVNKPILNRPFEAPGRYWQLDEAGRPTGMVMTGRRPSVFLVPIPAARRRQSDAGAIDFERYEDNTIVNRIRSEVDKWRARPADKQNVTYVTQRLLHEWRDGKALPRPFFCQIEAAETMIWLNEVAPHTAEGKRILDDLKVANAEANPQLLRYAAKMATGSGKTTVMAMLIAYHTINKARQPRSPRFSNNFLIVTPGITIKDRLRVLLPSGPRNYYEGRGIVPPEFSEDIKRARIVITNYHAFMLREKQQLTKGTRQILKGNTDKDLDILETKGQMLERVCKELLRSKETIVINDEAHHCYRHKDIDDGVKSVKHVGDEKDEAKKNSKAAHLWISGIEALGEKVSLRNVYDLSATPFFLSGSGYPEGHLFPWVVSDFGLMDAIECGIVKLPRVPIDDGTITDDNLPVFRNIYQHVKKDLPRRGRSSQEKYNPDALPEILTGGIQVLYEHYAKTFQAWQRQGIDVPPAFIIVCNNTSTSKMVFDYVSGYELPNRAGVWKQGSMKLFSNVDEYGKLRPRMHTLLIDSEQLDSGDALTKEFRQAAAVEIDQFKLDMRKRFPDRDASSLTDEDLLREVMNTVGKKGYLGEQVRCVVSVSMLTEGWDANNVTHILGVRAFGTQLLCEQVVGRGLRRYSYFLEEEGESKGYYRPEYADVLGVPFTFASGTKVEQPDVPPPQTRIRALDERAHLAISFPRVRAYTVQIPDEMLVARFDDSNSRLTITPEDVPPVTEQQGIIGEGVMLTLEDLQQRRLNEVVFFLAALIAKRFTDPEDNVAPNRFRDLVPITRRWLKDYLICLGGTFPQYLLWTPIAIKAAERIFRACVRQTDEHKRTVVPIIDKFYPEGTSFTVDFLTRKKRLYSTRADKCHINIAVCDSDWEMSFCKLLEDEPNVFAYVRNDHLGFEVPYEYKKKSHLYYPDFIALIDDGFGRGDMLSLVIEIKGRKDDMARAKADTMNRCWIPAINGERIYGRWAFVEIMDMQDARAQLAQFTIGDRKLSATG